VHPSKRIPCEENFVPAFDCLATPAGLGGRFCLIGYRVAALQGTANKPCSFEISNHGRWIGRRGRLAIASFYNNRSDGRPAVVYRETFTTSWGVCLLYRDMGEVQKEKLAASRK
jgi:hypothetical protein